MNEFERSHDTTITTDKKPRETQLLHKSKKHDRISFDISTKNTDCQVAMAQPVQQAIAAQKNPSFELRTIHPLSSHNLAARV